MSQNNFMKLALEQAQIAFDKDEVPVGALVVENGEILSQTHNQNISLSDPTAHAEILALRQAANIKKSPRLDGCDLYVTLEPCSMCASAIALSRIRRVYYALSDEKFGAVENGCRIFHNNFTFYKPEIYSGFYERESKELLQQFFQSKR